MKASEINPQFITKPIQLLSAWLVGLAVIDGSFLTAAATIQSPAWVPGVLVLSAIVNVPIFLFCLFLLQTKFRPEMQEDTYYSKYLERKYSDSNNSNEKIDLEEQALLLADNISKQIGTLTHDQTKKITDVVKDSQLSILISKFKKSRSLSELHLFGDRWHEIVNTFFDHHSFIDDITSLKLAGLVKMENDEPQKAKLTNIGRIVAEQLEKSGKLWNQLHDRDDNYLAMRSGGLAEARR